MTGHSKIGFVFSIPFDSDPSTALRTSGLKPGRLALFFHFRCNQALCHPLPLCHSRGSGNPEFSGLAPRSPGQWPAIGFVFSAPKLGYLPIILSLHMVYVNPALCQIGFVFSTAFVSDPSTLLRTLRQWRTDWLCFFKWLIATKGLRH